MVGGAGGRDGTTEGGGAGGPRPPPPPRGSTSLKLNCRKNSLVSLFQWLQNLVSDLSTSRDGTLNPMVSYGSAANRRYCHFLSGGSTFCS